MVQLIATVNYFRLGSINTIQRHVDLGEPAGLKEDCSLWHLVTRGYCLPNCI